MNKKKIIAFDVGDKWIGFAISDINQTLTFPREKIEKNNYSEQTKKVLQFKKEIELIYKDIPIFLEDERYSSKFANNLTKFNKNSKNSEHSIAACLILENFLIKKNLT